MTWATLQGPPDQPGFLEKGAMVCKVMWDKYQKAKTRVAELDDAKHKQAMMQHVSTRVNLAAVVKHVAW